jgi:gag-polypeptide of LTR copia-type/GAG-pre-integrase domain
MSPTISNMNATLLNESNWTQWKFEIEGRLMQKGISAALHSETVTSEKNERALGIIRTSIEPSQYRLVQNCVSAKEAFANLAEYHQPNTTTDRVDLLREYGSIKWNYKTEVFQDFITRMKTIRDKLELLGDREPEDVTVAKILSLLPWELRHVVHMVGALPTSQQTVARAAAKITTEIKEAVRQGVLQGVALTMSPATSRVEGALTAVAPQRNNRRFNNDSKRTGKCNYCGHDGHWARECFKKRRDRDQAKNRDQGKNPRRDNDSSGNMARDHDMLFMIQAEANLTMDDEKIVIDSGASVHMTGNIEYLHEVEDCQRPLRVANGHTAMAHKMGKMCIKTPYGNIKMNDVLLVEGMKNTLFSIAAIDRENDDCSIEIGGGKCKIHINGKKMGHGYLSEDKKLYILDGEVVLPEMVNASEDSSTLEQLWHQRLGHLPITVLQKCADMQLGLPQKLKEDLGTCENCIMAKMKRITPPQKATRTYNIGECWVSDTKGPMKTDQDTIQCTLMSHPDTW